MLRLAGLVVIVVAVVVISGCGGASDVEGASSGTATGGAATEAGSDGTGAGTRPADFTVTYSWRDGSVAPEYYSEYEITIGPGDGGVIRYTPTYPGDGVPVWERTFALTPAQLDELYRLAQADDALRNDWQTEPPPIGGPSESARIVADARTYEIPSDISEAEATLIGGLYPAIDALVPERVWDELEAQRADFVATLEPPTPCGQDSC